MNKCLVPALLIALMATASVQADLVLNIKGVPGSGTTTFEFVTFIGGSGTTSGSGTVRTNAGSTWSTSDTTQFGTGNGIANSSYQDTVFAMTGGATITVGLTTETMTGIFLDDDGTGQGDDIGVRVANAIPYASGETVTWTGTGTVAGLDINDFVEGTFQMDFGALWLLDQDNTVVNISAIPEPSGLAVLGSIVAFGLMGWRRR